MKTLSPWVRGLATATLMLGVTALSGCIVAPIEPLRVHAGYNNCPGPGYVWVEGGYGPRGRPNRGGYWERR